MTHRLRTKLRTKHPCQGENKGLMESLIHPLKMATSKDDDLLWMRAEPAGNTLQRFLQKKKPSKTKSKRRSPEVWHVISPQQLSVCIWRVWSKGCWMSPRVCVRCEDQRSESPWRAAPLCFCPATHGGLENVSRRVPSGSFTHWWVIYVSVTTGQLVVYAKTLLCDPV